MENTAKLKLAWEKIKSASSVLVVGHVSPDPDALASIGSMLELLKTLKISSSAYADNKLDEVYGYIPNERLISKEKPNRLADFSVILILDCGAISRTSLEPELRALLAKRKENQAVTPYIIEFDHHESRGSFADLEVRIPSKASTTEIIYDFFEINGLEINKAIADCILIGLMADTGNFLHANSSFEVMAASSDMLLRGASLNKISEHIRGTGSFMSLKVWGRALEKIKFNQETGLVCSALTSQDFSELLRPEERDSVAEVFGDIASFMSYLSGAKLALFLREEKGKVKGSFRTNSDEIDVSKLAQKFGGGGHKRAAGFISEGYLEETESGWRIVI
ncbi:MAG TPA: DHH family phosphoesterase [Candidatus Saccharimonadales bacterium]|nr:DHH family phosphoesterase [Candidatus Saccharimonadales bacterium]